MILSKTPFRISFCGGGSDLPAFLKSHDGCVISTTINKYLYIAIQKSFTGNIVLKYSEIERISNACEISHRLFKKCLLNENISGVEITSMADIPKGTGMGSSSAFTVGLINAIYSYKNLPISKKKMATMACEIEMELSNNIIGKQDQYASAFGGFNYITFKKNGNVSVSRLNLSSKQLKELNSNLFIYHVGGEHCSQEILSDQATNITSDTVKTENLVKMCKIVKKLKKQLLDGNLDYMGEALHQNWLLKKTLSNKISSVQIDKIYDYAIENGATGGKVLGAGGGGFMLFYVPSKNHKTFIDKMKKYRRFEYSFEQEGTKVYKI